MYTVDDVMDAEPCYTRGEVEVLFQGKKVLSALEICDYHSVPMGDRIWILIRLLDREALRSIVWDITGVGVGFWEVDDIGIHLSNYRFEKAVARGGLDPEPEQEAQLAVFRKNILLFTMEFDRVLL